MTMNEGVHKMRAQILNLRSAGIACATAIHYFPPCGRPGSCNSKCPEARVAMKRIYEDMYELLLSTRTALASVVQPAPEAWDFLWSVAEDSTCKERDIAQSTFGQALSSVQNDFIRSCAEIGDDTMEKFGTTFREEEWQILKAEGAWQNGPRLPQVLHLLTYLENEIAKQFDLFDSILYCGLLGDCTLGRWAAKKRAAIA